MMIKKFATTAAPATATAGSIDSAIEKAFEIISASELTESRQNDVLLGRGSGVNTHPGNSYFRSLVKQYKLEYVTSTAPMKKQIIVDIIGKVVNQQTPPGRFLKLDHKTKQWQCISYLDAKKKTGQALREDQSKLRTVQECDIEKEVIAHLSSNVNNRERAYSCGEDDSRPTSSPRSHGVYFPSIAGALKPNKTVTFDPTYMCNPQQFQMVQMKLAAHVSSNVNNRKRAYCGEDDSRPTSRSHVMAFPSRITGALEAQEAGAFDPTYIYNPNQFLGQMNPAANMSSRRMPLCPNGEQYDQYTDDCFFPNSYARFLQERARPEMQRRGYKTH